MLNDRGMIFVGEAARNRHRANDRQMDGAVEEPKQGPHQSIDACRKE
jgi:hypothetical protein